MKREAFRLNPLIRTMCLGFILVLVSSISFGQQPLSTYTTGNYRMVFSEYALEPEGGGSRAVHPLTDVDPEIEAMYNQLFKTGDPNSQRIMFDATGTPSGLKFIKDINSNDIRSEGMSYGMMIAVMMNDQETFDALWGFVREYMHHPANNWYSWSLQDQPGYPVSAEEGASFSYGEGPAPDAEEYFAMALFFADHRWGDSGDWDYNYWANDTLNILRNSGLWNSSVNMPEFTPNGGFTDPSYHLPAFYELWNIWADNPATWDRAADASRSYFTLAVDTDSGTPGTNTGLFPEYTEYNGNPHFENYNELSNHSAFDSFRVIQNMAMDFYWWSWDDRALYLTEGIMAFYNNERELSTPVGNNFASFQYTGVYGLGQNREFYITTDPGGNPNSFPAGASPWRARASAPIPGLAAMNAVGALATDAPYARKFVQYLWDSDLRTGPERYYDGLLQMFGYLHLAGYFRIYKPNVGAELDLSFDPGRKKLNTQPLIFWHNPTYFTVAGCPHGESEGAFSWQLDFLTDGFPTQNGTLTRLSNGRWFGEIPPVAPARDEFELNVTRTCNGSAETDGVGGFVDPSGYVRTTTGYPIPDAEVVLFQTETSYMTSPLVQLPDGSDQMSSDNRSNPDFTDANGHFGWDVAPGHWYEVVASHPDCFNPDDPSQKEVATGLMFVPPAHTNVDIRLECPGDTLTTSVDTYNDWGTGYCANLVVTNNGPVSVDWNTRFHVDGTIDSLWGAIYSQAGIVVNAEGFNWNNLLQPGQSTQGLGFCATRNNTSGPYTVKVRARGTSGTESVKLTVGGQTVAQWTLANNFNEKTFTTDLSGGINVEYINDYGFYRDVVIDWVEINGVRHEAEDQTNYSGSASGTGNCDTGYNDGWLHCNGFIGFSAFK